MDTGTNFCSRKSETCTWTAVRSLVEQQSMVWKIRRQKKKMRSRLDINFNFFTLLFFGWLSFRWKGWISCDVTAGSNRELLVIHRTVFDLGGFCRMLYSLLLRFYPSLTPALWSGLSTMAYWAAATVLKVHTTVPVFYFSFDPNSPVVESEDVALLRDRLHWWRFVLFLFTFFFVFFFTLIYWYLLCFLFSNL